MKLKNLDLHLMLLLLCCSVGLYVLTNCSYSQNNPKFHATVYKDTIIDNHTFSEEKLNALMYVLEIEHPEIVIKQAKLETGNFTSHAFREDNNLFGFMKGKEVRHYDDWRQSVLHYAHWQNVNYRGGDYYKFLIKVGYAQDSLYIAKLKSM